MEEEAERPVLNRYVRQAAMKTRTTTTRMPRPMPCCRRGRSYQHDAAARWVLARKSLITTHTHFVTTSDMQFNSNKALHAHNSFRKCRLRIAVWCIQPLSCRRPFAPNVLAIRALMADDGKKWEGGAWRCLTMHCNHCISCSSLHFAPNVSNHLVHYHGLP
jgi:hypothetical protein